MQHMVTLQNKRAAQPGSKAELLPMWYNYTKIHDHHHEHHSNHVVVTKCKRYSE